MMSTERRQLEDTIRRQEAQVRSSSSHPLIVASSPLLFLSPPYPSPQLLPYLLLTPLPCSQVQSLQLERAASTSLEERFRDMQTQRDCAEAERSQLQEELAANNARHAGRGVSRTSHTPGAPPATLRRQKRPAAHA